MNIPKVLFTFLFFVVWISKNLVYVDHATEVRKHTGSQFKGSSVQHSFPPAIDHIAECLVLERMAVGEECCSDVVESALLCAIESWNDKVDEFRTILAKAAIQQSDHDLKDGTSEEVAAVDKQMKETLTQYQSILQKYDITKTGGAIRMQWCHVSCPWDGWFLTDTSFLPRYKDASIEWY